MATEHVSALIVGGGLAGLACARRLHRAGHEFLLVEAADAVGGRVRTDAIDGFLFDRGFQVLLAAYPEARRVLDYGALHLQPFFSGAYVMKGGTRSLVADPVRHPLAAASTLSSSFATWGDRLRVAALRLEAAASDAPPAERPADDIPTSAFLEDRGFSTGFMQSFLTPFFRGIFLENHLQTSARMFHFVFGMMARGQTTLPLAGMEAIPRQLAKVLPPDSVRVASPCVEWAAEHARLADGTVVHFRYGVLATDAAATAKLLAVPPPPLPRSTTCLYFAARRSPLERPAICLNGDGIGLVNHVAVPSDVSPRYAPPGASLISVSLIGEPDLPENEMVARVLAELREWFGSQTQAWRFLRSYRIPFAQPNQDAGIFAHPRATRSGDGAWLCGDHITDASIDGALRSGRQTAEAILEAAGSTGGASQ